MNNDGTEDFTKEEDFTPMSNDTGEDFTAVTVQDALEVLSQQLNPQQMKFVEAYLKNGFNGTKAYITAYPGTTYMTASVGGSALLSKPNVKSFTQLFRRLNLQDTQITFQSQVAELNELIDSCKTQGVDGEGKIHDRSNWMKALQEKNKMMGLTTHDDVKSSAPISISLDLTPTPKIINIEPSKPSEPSNDSDDLPESMQGGPIEKDFTAVEPLPDPTPQGRKKRPSRAPSKKK